MLLREKVDEEGSNFGDNNEGTPVYLCAEPIEEGKYLLFEQYGGFEKEKEHDINRKVVVTKEFIEKLHSKIGGDS
jgi:hypothetical protein